MRKYFSFQPMFSSAQLCKIHLYFDLGTPIDNSPVTLSFKETTPVKQSKRRREFPQIDVTQLDSDKENAKEDSEDEELPAFNL